MKNLFVSILIVLSFLSMEKHISALAIQSSFNNRPIIKKRIKQELKKLTDIPNDCMAEIFTFLFWGNIKEQRHVNKWFNQRIKKSFPSRYIIDFIKYKIYKTLLTMPLNKAQDFCINKDYSFFKVWLKEQNLTFANLFLASAKTWLPQIHSIQDIERYKELVKEIILSANDSNLYTKIINCLINNNRIKILKYFLDKGLLFNIKHPDLLYHLACLNNFNIDTFKDFKDKDLLLNYITINPNYKFNALYNNCFQNNMDQLNNYMHLLDKNKIDLIKNNIDKIKTIKTIKDLRDFKTYISHNKYNNDNLNYLKTIIENDSLNQFKDLINLIDAINSNNYSFHILFKKFLKITIQKNIYNYSINYNNYFINSHSDYKEFINSIEKLIYINEKLSKYCYIDKNEFKLNLLANKEKLNGQDENGMDRLMHFSTINSKSLLFFPSSLFYKGMLINKDHLGKDALMYFLNNRHSFDDFEYLTNLFLKQGFNLFNKDYNGTYAWMYLFDKSDWQNIKTRLFEIMKDLDNNKVKDNENKDVIYLFNLILKLFKNKPIINEYEILNNAEYLLKLLINSKKYNNFFNKFYIINDDFYFVLKDFLLIDQNCNYTFFYYISEFSYKNQLINIKESFSNNLVSYYLFLKTNPPLETTFFIDNIDNILEKILINHIHEINDINILKNILDLTIAMKNHTVLRKLILNNICNLDFFKILTTNDYLPHILKDLEFYLFNDQQVILNNIFHTINSYDNLKLFLNQIICLHTDDNKLFNRVFDIILNTLFLDRHCLKNILNIIFIEISLNNIYKNSVLNIISNKLNEINNRQDIKNKDILNDPSILLILKNNGILIKKDSFIFPLIKDNTTTQNTQNIQPKNTDNTLIGNSYIPINFHNINIKTISLLTFFQDILQKINLSNIEKPIEDIYQYLRSINNENINILKNDLLSFQESNNWPQLTQDLYELIILINNLNNEKEEFEEEFEFEFEFKKEEDDDDVIMKEKDNSIHKEIKNKISEFINKYA